MKIDIQNIDEYIKKNDIKQITSPTIFVSGSSLPDPEGLGSYDIFGKPGTYERKHQFGYIELNDIFIHPHIFNLLVSLRRIIESVAYARGEFYIKDGMYERLAEGMDVKGPTGYGIRFIYDTWEQLDFSKDTKSATVKDKILLISKLKKEEVFITKFLVIPPFYRDVDTATGKKNEINIMYQRMVSLSSTIKSSSSMFYGGQYSDAHRKMMDTLTELYTYFVSFTTGTKGFIHKHVIGKPTDFSARLVISTPSITSNKPEDMEVSFSHSAIPLHVVLKCFAPFIVYEFKQYVINKLQGSKFLYLHTKTGLERVELSDHYTEELMSESIYALIDMYYESKIRRLDYFTLLGADDSRIPVVYKTIENKIVTAIEGNKSVIQRGALRPVTLTELFYIVAMNIVKDKYVYVTRYPVEDYHNIYPTKMNIIPYSKYKPLIVENIEYPRYPDINRAKDINNVENMFIDTLRIFPTYLSALGGDYDGDQVAVQGVFGNNEADEYIYSKSNIVNIAGDAVRTTLDITAHTLFALTRQTDNI